MARKLPPYRFKKASYAKAHPGQCKRVTTPSGARFLCRIGKKRSKKRGR